MPDLADGESVEVQGSGSNKYQLKNTGGVYSCSCPAWRNQGAPIEARSCKHLRAYRGEAEEAARVGNPAVTRDGASRAPRPPRPAGEAGGEEAPEGKEPPLLLAHKWENDTDLTGWWMSEKLDGVRAYWDGKVFWSRLGNLYRAPAWFVEKLPPHPLDGELWVGRQKFQRTISIVRRYDASDAWREVRYLVFDAPAHVGSFEERLAHCREWFSRNASEWARAHDHEPCKSTAHLKEELARVESLGGEGLMMRRPGSKYEVGRSSSLLKVKSFHDAEAKVVEHLKGKGKHAGRTGALLLEMPDGTRFSAGTGMSDAERENPPPLGSIVTYRYQELSEGGVPRFPSYVGVRHDVKWKPAPAARKKPLLADAKVVEHLAGVAGRTGALLVELADGKKIPLGAGLTDAEQADPPPVGSVISYRFEGTTDSGLPRAATFVGVRSYADEAAPAPPRKTIEETPAASGPIRRFEFVEGTSSKFWEIETRGALQVVRFGRLGTKGQEKSKTFPSPEAATADSDKLVAEKTKKGYVPA